MRVFAGPSKIMRPVDNFVVLGWAAGTAGPKLALRGCPSRGR
jgi:hypothetical protein